MRLKLRNTVLIWSSVYPDLTTEVVLRDGRDEVAEILLAPHHGEFFGVLLSPTAKEDEPAEKPPPPPPPPAIQPEPERAWPIVVPTRRRRKWFWQLELVVEGLPPGVHVFDSDRFYRQVLESVMAREPQLLVDEANAYAWGKLGGPEPGSGTL